MEKLLVWAVIIGGISLFRLIRRMRRDVNQAARARSTARINAAAERILAAQGRPPSHSAGDRAGGSGMKPAKKPMKPARNRPARAGAAILQPKRRSAVIRLSTPVTTGVSAVQRRR